MCTRFATEVILRRSPEESANIIIVPGDDRIEGERVALSTFLKKSVDLGHLEALINKAKNVMGLGGDAMLGLSAAMSSALKCPGHRNHI